MLYLSVLISVFGVLFSLNEVEAACNATIPDRLDNCTPILDKQYLCYSILDLCCQTCLRYSTDVPGCQFGDKQPNCTFNNCLLPNGTPNAEYQDLCCGTCNQLTNTTQPPVIPPGGTVPPGTGITTTPSTVGGNYCLIPLARYRSVSCKTVQSWLGNVCSIAFLRTSCCRICPPGVRPTLPGTTLCPNPLGRYYSVSCDSINWEASMCADPVFNSNCCKNCTGVTGPSGQTKKCLKIGPTRQVCRYVHRLTRMPEDDFCRLKYVGNVCCQVCTRTQISRQCSDKSINCAVMARIAPDYVCIYRNYCCKSCDNIQKLLRQNEIITLLRRLGGQGQTRTRNTNIVIED